MLLSHERLAALKEQRDYLEKLLEFQVRQERGFIEMFGTVGPEAKRQAEQRADEQFKAAGLDVALNRINLEIPFLDEFLNS